jgi:hypothetical protein
MTEHEDPITPSDALDVAHRIATRLATNASWTGDACTWTISTVGVTGVDGTLGAQQALAGPSLYQGTAGIGLFLAECDRLTGDRALRRAAAGAFRHAVRVVDARPYSQFGFYSGDVGLAYALHRYEQCCGNVEFADTARRLVTAFAHHEYADKLMDVVSGAAGTLLGAVSLHGAFGSEALDVARRCGDHLLAKSRRGAGGWSWFAADTNARDLTGLAHGTAGIAQALLELSAATGEPSYRFGAEQGFAYEREFKTEDNWLDLRHLAAFDFARRPQSSPERARQDAAAAPAYAPRTMVAWCHGAAGIALTRLRAYALLGDSSYRADAEMAVSTVRDALHRRRLGGDFSLCHGMAGISETLLLAATVLGDREADTDVRRIAAAGARIERAGAPWPCGTLDGPNDPSLFVGEAGIGLHYLRLASEDVPSVLLIAGTSAAVAVPQGGIDRLTVLRTGYTTEHFGCILHVLSRFGVPLENSYGDGVLPGASAVDRVFASIDATIASETRAHRRAQFQDAFAPERARYAMRTSIPARSDEFLARAARLPSSEIDWDGSTISLSPHACMVETRWDWDAWLADGNASAEPAFGGNTYLVHCHEGMTQLTLLTPMAAAVLGAATDSASLAAVVARVAVDADGDAERAFAWRPSVLAQLVELYHAGILVVRPLAAADPVETWQVIHA